MAHNHPRCVPFFFFFFLLLPPLLASTTHRLRHPLLPPDTSSLALSPSSQNAGPPLIFFEVSQPADLPGSQPCSYHLLQHAFADTHDLPPAIANYTPPSHCGQAWDKAVLKWSGTCKGRQYDRIAAVWFSGVEVLRTCTAEPTKQGIYWEVKKDITRFSALLRKPQLLVLELGNVVDNIYTGIFHINLTLEFYKSHPSVTHVDSYSCLTAADLVLPISLLSPLPEGYWFQLRNKTQVASKSLQIPRNVYRAVLEICVSYHGSDEFWYTNPPNDYIRANNLTGDAGNGPFREVQAFIDGKLVGTVWPFPVIYTGGINPLFWRPAAAIGAFALPSYDVDVTPFVGLLVDGQNHVFSLRVENALGNWPVDANLHLWLDHSLATTKGGLLTYEAPPYSLSLDSQFEGLDGTFHTIAKRSISYSGYVEGSFGYVITQASYSLDFDNVLVFENDTEIQIVTQSIQTKGEVLKRTGSEVVYSQQVSLSLPLYLYCLQYDGSDGSMTENCKLTHGFNREEYLISPTCTLFSSLHNSQEAEGDIIISKENIVTSGIGALQQKYDYVSNLGCYYRTLSTKNYTILYDSSGSGCINSS